MKEQIILLIKKLGTSKKEFAGKIEISTGNLSDLISGRIKSLSHEAIVRIAKEFNVDPLWLLTGEGEMFLSRKEVARDARTEDAFEVARKVVQNPKMRKFVERILDLDKKNFEKLQAYLDGMEGK